MGKSPLRLVCTRTLLEKGIWNEKLECGHEVTAFQEFLWDERRCLVEFEPTAKRRRCQKCKPFVAPVFKTKQEITAAQAQAALIHERKLKFGSLFEKLCFENGEMRPGELSEYNLPHKTERSAHGSAGLVDEEPNADGTSSPAPYDSTPSPRKPVQSVRTTERRKAA